MNKLLTCSIILVACASSVRAEEIVNSFPLPATEVTLPVTNNQLGTGAPVPMVTVGDDPAYYVDDGYYHTPQYMPNYPTAAVIWPRVVQLDCERKADGRLVCDGYHWTPKLGRGEYLFVVPKMKEQHQCCTAAPIVIYKEVPAKKPGE